ncbi:unnamed protein product [Arctia plantaginis]|uniref:Uncharacterized protein n=1 Tax=Arctia plantaginis TaxID=874455 RepID=A0A8S0ZTE8_ARCPL|nr:unnamed protein product [Arctia plantaginis]CAB3238510.1 unnamed protein product [Arctia plantaginis]
MFMIVLIVTVALANCLEPVADNKLDDEIKQVITKYLAKIPDVEPQYVIHEGLSKVISRYFKGKVSTFPLYKVSLKLDRNPVKIPWSLADESNANITANVGQSIAKKGKIYKYIPAKTTNNTA